VEGGRQQAQVLNGRAPAPRREADGMRVCGVQPVAYLTWALLVMAGCVFQQFL
jgi:hypothetical protein